MIYSRKSLKRTSSNPPKALPMWLVGFTPSRFTRRSFMPDKLTPCTLPGAKPEASHRDKPVLLGCRWLDLMPSRPSLPRLICLVGSLSLLPMASPSLAKSSDTKAAVPAKFVPMAAKDEAALFKKAVAEFKGQNYATAIINFDKVYWNGGKHYNDALFFIIRCQEKQGLIAQMKTNYQYLKVGLLSKKHRKKFVHLKAKYENWTPPEPKTVFFSLSPYVGSIGYSGSETKDKGQFLGTGFSISNLKHTAAIAYESLGISFNNGATEYSQSQLGASYWGYFGTSFGLHLAAASIGVNDAYKAYAGQVLTLGAKLYSLYSYDLGIDIHSSHYQDFSYGDLKLLQLSPYAGMSLGSLASGITYIRVAVDQVSPDLQRKYPKESLKELENSQLSFEASVSYSKNLWTPALSYWTGSRIFTVGAGGAAVTNNEKLYQSGYNLSLSKAFTTTSLTLSYGAQSYKDAEVESEFPVTSAQSYSTQVIGLVGGWSF